MTFEPCFAGKRVLITGDGNGKFESYTATGALVNEYECQLPIWTGIGRAVAVKLHGCGAKVVGIDKDSVSLQSLHQDCPGTEVVTVDLSDWNATRAAVENI